MQVYLDNAATTPLDPEVITAMQEFMQLHYGNPSSVHAKGREARVKIETVRKQLVSMFGCKEKELLFTSGGTEGNNAILKSIALSHRVKRIISSQIEHHSVLDTLQWIEEHTAVEIVYLQMNEQGDISLKELEQLLQQPTKTLVSLMHANNETGNLLNINSVGALCQSYSALLHSDMVQTFGHLPINLSDLPIDFATGSAHKIHGPKGVGFIYVNSNTSKFASFQQGGAQERGIRGGTENGYGIIGMGKAYNIASQNRNKELQHFITLKKHLISGLTKTISGITFNGNSANDELSLANIISLKLPDIYDDTLLLKLDIQGVYVSEGSACSSGATEGSHVINAMFKGQEKSNNLRLSFSKYTTTKDLDYFISTLVENYT